MWAVGPSNGLWPISLKKKKGKSKREKQPYQAGAGMKNRGERDFRERVEILIFLQDERPNNLVLAQI